MALNEEQKQKLTQLKVALNNGVEVTKTLKVKAESRVKKALERKEWAAKQKGGGLGFIEGLVTKFKKAHTPMNQATLAAAMKFDTAVLSAYHYSTDWKLKVERALDNDDALREVDLILKQKLDTTILSRLIEVDNLGKAYKTAKDKEKAIYAEFEKYMKEKAEKKDGDTKEYKLWKATIEQNIKDLSKD